MEKTVGVVIPVYRPGRLFHELLRRLARQTHIPEEVVIINTIPEPQGGGAAQQTETAEIAEKFRASFPVLTVLEVRQKDFGHGKTRDLGVGHTDTELVLCMTQDALPRDSRLVERRLCPASSRAQWGASSPTKLISPVTLTTAATTSVANVSSRKRIRPTGTPSSRASSSSTDKSIA